RDMSQTVHGHAGKLSERTGFVTPMLERPILNTKHQTPNTKLQTPSSKHQKSSTSKLQIPKNPQRPESRHEERASVVGIWLFGFLWCLVFGVWCLEWVLGVWNWSAEQIQLRRRAEFLKFVAFGAVPRLLAHGALGREFGFLEVA